MPKTQPTGDLYILYPDPPLPRLPLVVTEIGASWWPAGHRLQRPRSAIMALEWVTEGCLHLVQDGRAAQVGPGDVCILKRGVAHQYAATDGPVRKRFIGLSGALAEQLTAAAPDHLTPTAQLALTRSFDRILALFRTRPPGWMYDAAGLGYRLLAEFSDRTTDAAQARHPAVATALRLIHERSAQPPAIAWLAREAGVSAAHLTRLFLRDLGLTPARYAQRCRIDQARFLLAGSTLSCQAIAARLGFDDPLYFSKVFRRFAKESPLAYRQRHR